MQSSRNAVDVKAQMLKMPMRDFPNQTGEMALDLFCPCHGISFVSSHICRSGHLFLTALH
jgi:hypothetical protein